MTKSIYTTILTALLMLAIPAALCGNNRIDNPDNAKSGTDANITGHVRDAKTGEHLPFINIAVKGTTIGVATDATGHYMIKDLPIGELTLQVSYIGYRKIEKTITTKANTLLELNFELEEESLSLNEVVVSATRSETVRREAPALVNVIDMKLFDRTQSTDVAQGLKFQPGVRVETNCQNCGFTQVRINGMDGPYSQILIDSRPVFSALAGVYGLEQIPANMIERVEVMRGGGSALFGSSAIAGTINIITREPIGNSASLSHQTRAVGGFGAIEHTTNFNGSLVTDNHRMGVTVFGQTRHRDGYDRDGDGYTESPLLDGRTAGFRAFVKTSNYSKLTAEYHNTHEFRRGGDLLKVQPHNAHIAEQLEHTNHVGSLNYTLFSPDARHRLNVYASFMNISRKSYYGGGDRTANELQSGKPEDVEELKNRMNSYGRTHGLTAMAGAQYGLGFDRLLFMPAQLTLGAEYTDDRLDDISGYRTAPIAQRVNTASAFVQNEWKNSQWSILLGARLDKHSMVKRAIVSPRINLRYNPSQAVSFRLSYSKGFRAPQLFDEDLHVDNAGGEIITSRNAPDLKEETSHSFSASADWYHCFGAWQLNLLGEGFVTSLDDAFGFTQQVEKRPDGSEQIVKIRSNTDGARVYGLNLEGKLAYTNRWQLQGGLTAQRSLWNKAQQWHEDDAYTTRRMYRTPDLYAYFVNTIELGRRFSFSLSGNWTGNMLTGHEIPTEKDGTLTQFNGRPAATIHTDRLMQGDGQTSTTYGPRTFRTPAFFEMGCKLTYTLPIYKVYSLQLYAGIQNMFDAFQDDFDRGPSRDSAYIYGPGAPRSGFAGLKLTL